MTLPGYEEALGIPVSYTHLMRCQYCHNPDTWEMGGGTEMKMCIRDRLDLDIEDIE